MSCVSVHKGKVDQKLTFCYGEVWFLFGWVSVHNNRYWTAQNPYLNHEISLHDSKTGISCT